MRQKTTFTLSEYKDAKIILSVPREEYLYPSFFYRWASRVMKFYNDIWEQCRSMVGSWAARVKLAWESIKKTIISTYQNNTFNQLSKRFKGIKHTKEGIFIPVQSKRTNKWY